MVSWRSFWLVLALGSSVHASIFEYPDFSDTSALTFVRSAGTYLNRLRLNGNGTIGSTAGSVWTKAKHDVAWGFETSFTFSIGENRVGSGSDLLYFAVQNRAPDASWTYPNYANSPPNGTPLDNNVLYVGLDTYQNPWDPNNWHTEYAYIGFGKRLNNASEFVLPDGKNSDVHELVVRYDAINTRLLAYYDGIEVLNETFDLANSIELDRGTAWVGFHAVSGFTPETHDVHSWSWRSNSSNAIPEPASASIWLLITTTLLSSSYRRWRLRV